MRSKDLEEWGAPELMRVKGPSVPPQKMGRMIDAYILNDKDNSTKWWSFFKQDGVSRSWSSDLQHWNYVGHAPAGENVCVIVDKGEYLMFDSPANGVGMQRSRDLRNWTDLGILTLGQATWPWASGRLTAAFVLDLRNETSIGKALMFFHGSAYPESDPRGGFDSFASLGLAWSEGDGLTQWSWPGKEDSAELPLKSDDDDDDAHDAHAHAQPQYMAFYDDDADGSKFGAGATAAFTNLQMFAGPSRAQSARPALCNARS